MKETYFIPSVNRFRFFGTENDFSREVSRYFITESGADISEYEITHFTRYLFNALFDERSFDGFAYTRPRDFGIDFSEDESIEIKRIEHPTTEERIPNTFYLSWYEYKYYINLKSSTITMLALLLDLHFTNGVASTILALLGVNNKALARIPDSTGERCVLIEICRQKQRRGNKDVFMKIKGAACVNNNLACKHNKNGICTISDTDIDHLFDILTEKNVLTKTDEGFKYNM